MSLTRVPTHSIWRTLHHSSASRSAETPKMSAAARCPLGSKEPRPPLRRQTWFASKGLGGVITEINPDGVLLGAFWQSSYALHIVEFCNLKEEPRWARGQKASSPRTPPTEQKGEGTSQGNTEGAGQKEECVRRWVISGSPQCLARKFTSCLPLLDFSEG